MLTLELSSYLLEFPHDAHTTRCQNLIRLIILSQGHCKPIVWYSKMRRIDSFEHYSPLSMTCSQYLVLELIITRLWDHKVVWNSNPLQIGLGWNDRKRFTLRLGILFMLSLAQLPLIRLTVSYFFIVSCNSHGNTYAPVPGTNCEQFTQATDILPPETHRCPAGLAFDVGPCVCNWPSDFECTV